MLLIFAESNKWTGGIGNPDYEVVAGVPIDVCDYTAKLALDSGKAKPHTGSKNEGNPAKLDKAKAKRQPAKKDKKRADKK